MTILSSQRRLHRKSKNCSRRRNGATGASNRSDRQYPSGFTLVELLVVIGIITVLISILIPVIDKVRNASYNASTQAEMSSLEAAITQYDNDFGAYPGPLSNDQIEGAQPSIPGVTGTISGSENLVLGLLGGLNNIGGTMKFVPAEVGLGPLVLNTAGNPQRHPPYMTAQGTTLLPTPGTGPVWTAIWQDSTIPEFVDRYPSPLPILYLRARVGATGVVSKGPNGCQYDLKDISPYTSPNAQGAYLGSNTQNLQAVGSTTGTIKSNGITNGYVYFFNRSTGTARAVDQYILIAAGSDRIYGTADDATSFGDPSQ